MSEGIDSIRPVGSLSSGDAVSSHENTATSLTDTSARASAPTPVASNAADRQADTVVSAESSNPPSLQAAVDQLNARLAGADRVLELRVDAASGITIAEIKNASTGQVLRQMPGEDLVRLAQLLRSWSGGKSLLDLIA